MCVQCFVELFIDLPLLTCAANCHSHDRLTTVCVVLVNIRGLLSLNLWGFPSLSTHRSFMFCWGLLVKALVPESPRSFSFMDYVYATASAKASTAKACLAFLLCYCICRAQHPLPVLSEHWHNKWLRISVSFCPYVLASIAISYNFQKYGFYSKSLPCKFYHYLFSPKSLKFSLIGFNLVN